MQEVNASIVLYHNDKVLLKRAISSFLNTELKVKLYLIDNSMNDDLKELKQIDSRVEYIYNNKNIGFGAAHNIAIKKTLEDGVKYHLVLNPDIYHDGGVIEELCRYMDNDQEIGFVLPKVLYPDGEIQYIQKLLPTPFNLIARRFFSFGKKKNALYELRFIDRDKVKNIPSLSGCFMFLRTDTLKDVGMFDANFFMYMEDIDLSRRIHSKYKTIYYPKVTIYHEYAKDSYKNMTLLKYHLKSAIYYFNKWGWFFDDERKMINEKTLERLNYKKSKTVNS